MSGELPPTEHRNERSAGLDLLDTVALVELLVDEQHVAAEAVFARSRELAVVVDAIAARLERGGSLHYVGAGSSGRIGTLDAAEMPPTFGTAPELVRAHIAGGRDALVAAIEGAEDDGDAGEAAMRGVGSADAVVGISASGGAAFVVRAVERARALGAYTVAIVNVADSVLARAAETAIVLSTGAEAVAGSTRMKAGTAQKIALNTISTAVMVRLGKVYDNLMVDVVATNRKLQKRAVRLICTIAGVDESRASNLLASAGGRVKVAVVMERCGVGAEAARKLLEQRGGSLRSFL